MPGTYDIVIEPGPESPIRVLPSEEGGAPLTIITDTTTILPKSGSSGYIASPPSIPNPSLGSASYATKLFASGAMDIPDSNGTKMILSPSGVHLKPVEGTSLVTMLDDQYLAIAKQLDDATGSGDWRSDNPRVVLNIQHWDTPPENLEDLMTGLQQWADDFNFTVCLKWKDADGPKAYEFEPPVVREAQDGQVMMAESAVQDSPLLSDAKFLSDIKVPKGQTSRDFLENNLKPYLDESTWKTVEDLFLCENPRAVSEIRGEISRDLGGSFQNLNAVVKALKNALERRGFNELEQLGKFLTKLVGAEVDEGQSLTSLNAFNALLRHSGLNLLPDEIPVFRVVSTKAVVREADGSVFMNSNEHGMSFWGVGNDGQGVAETYAKSEAPPFTILKTTLKELREAGKVEYDGTAKTGNALELRHGTETPGTTHNHVRVETVSTVPLPRSLPKAPPRAPARIKPATPELADPLGSDIVTFLAGRGGMGIMAMNPEQNARYFREEYGSDHFDQIEFLFQSDAASRSRVEGLRTKVAAKAQGRYPDLESAMKTVRETLKEEGIDFDAWRAERKTRLEAEWTYESKNMLNKMEKDVLDEVLLPQLLPDDVPLYRTTAYPGRSGLNGSSWYGVGDQGKGTAASYYEPGRFLITVKLGDLRKSGAVRVDEMAVVGNSVELYHRETSNASASGADAWSKVPYEIVTNPERKAQASGM